MPLKVEPQNLPHHVAIIMDGNGRWAQKKGLLRIQGHQEGVNRLEELIEVVPDYGVKYLTLYAFSKENWNRPKLEVSFLMNLLSTYLDLKLKKFHEHNVIFNFIGNLNDLPSLIQEKMKRNIEETKKNTGLVVTFAISYSSRLELLQACRKIAEKVAQGVLTPGDITEEMISQHLYTANLPDPDLLIRTSGEMRISNFLLWQISYAELYLTDKFWPEFTEEEFAKAIQNYQKRERRFGLTTVNPAS
ncbi:MAG: isoprenyl transferase [Candidatus Omnitrophica bacterium]|nr:isoprenyl transferase [Candidatus Omnitrophota bacterium]